MIQSALQWAVDCEPFEYFVDYRGQSHKVVAFSSLARIFRECSTIYSVPALFFLSLSGYLFMHTDSTLSDRINPQWLSKLGWLLLNVP